MRRAGHVQTNEKRYLINSKREQEGKNDKRREYDTKVLDREKRTKRPSKF